MPNTFLTPTVIAKEALMILQNNAVMPNLVYRDYSGDFNGKQGDTITVRKPAHFDAKHFTDTITTQEVKETGVPVKLDNVLDVSFGVTAKEMSLSIQDFSTQLLQPAMMAFLQELDKMIIKEAIKVTNEVKTAAKATAVDVDNLIDARKFLTKHAAPLADRRFVCNTDTEADLLKNKDFVSAAVVGDDGTALRDASLGRKYGLDMYVDQNVDAEAVKAIAFHKNAFALVTRVPDLPAGAAKAAVENYGGFGIRVVYGYDMQKKQDVVSLDMLCGVATLDKDLAAKITAGA